MLLPPSPPPVKVPAAAKISPPPGAPAAAISPVPATPPAPAVPLVNDPPEPPLAMHKLPTLVSPPAVPLLLPAAPPLPAAPMVTVCDAPMVALVANLRLYPPLPPPGAPAVKLAIPVMPEPPPPPPMHSMIQFTMVAVGVYVPLAVNTCTLSRPPALPAEGVVHVPSARRKLVEPPPLAGTSPLVLDVNTGASSVPPEKLSPVPIVIGDQVFA